MVENHKYRAPDAVWRALSIAKQHPEITDVGQPAVNNATGLIEVVLTVQVNLANAWRAAGQSPSGVLALEQVRADFPHDYPLHPPELSLRSDFSRENVHIQPWLTADGRPVPCIVDSDMSEALVRDGFGELLNRIVVWLDRAADGKLLDPQQGWEPTRRDNLDDIVLCDMAAMRARIRDHGGHAVYSFGFLQRGTREAPEWCVGDLLQDELELERLKSTVFGVEAIGNPQQLFGGRGPAVLIWPNTNQIADQYYPETVTDLASLRQRAELYRCDDELDTTLMRLKLWAESKRFDGRTGLLVLLCARRPSNLIGESSSIEISPYLIWDYNMDAPEAGSIPVRPAGHRARISQELLARVSGRAVEGDRRNWTLLGAGSLGSKLALNLARAGLGPSAIVDKQLMSPHNAARHALVPDNASNQLSWMQPKAELLANAVHGLGQTTLRLNKDIRDLAVDVSKGGEAWPDNTFIVVNTTASLVVREALNMAHIDVMPARVIELALYAAGQLGLIGVEGPGRNPRLGDLIAEFYAIAAETPAVADYLFGVASSALERVSIGEGCGSETMPMTDGRLSLFAAGMSEYMLACLSDGLPKLRGNLLIGRLTQQGLSVEWSSHEMQPVTVVEPDDADTWHVRVHERVSLKIAGEIDKWPNVETGGVLVGRVSEASRSINVVDALPAPDDSMRTASRFVLGTKDLTAKLQDIVSRTSSALYCIGTWHSHLTASGPSDQDRQTARTLAIARCTPSVLLIHTPAGYRALLADTI